MLIEHLREPFGGQRIPVATIVATDKDHIGVAICSYKDNFNKSLGVHIAHERAVLGKEPKIPNREVFDADTCHFVSMERFVQEGIERMRERASKYYK